MLHKNDADTPILQVRTIWWSSDDSTIVTAGVDGAIYEWRVKDYKRLRENVNKGTVYTSAIGMVDSKSFFAVGSDRKLKEVDENQVLKVDEVELCLILVTIQSCMA